ncbi:hypothetical protein FRB98_001552 [Tulasnella sp. 332]|nr:hypothetical protein FRB98_001552 [Tulasnella sp. 332]
MNMGGGPDKKLRESSPMDIDTAEAASRFPDVSLLPPLPPTTSGSVTSYQGPSEYHRGSLNSFATSMMPQAPVNEPGGASTFPVITPAPISPEHYIYTPRVGTFVPISLTTSMSSALALATQNPDTQQQQISPSLTAQNLPPPAYDSVGSFSDTGPADPGLMAIQNTTITTETGDSGIARLQSSAQLLQNRIPGWEGPGGPTTAGQGPTATISGIKSFFLPPPKSQGVKRCILPLEYLTAPIYPSMPPPLFSRPPQTITAHPATVSYQSTSEDLVHSGSEEQPSSPRITNERTSASAPHRAGSQEEADMQYPSPFGSRPAITSYQSQLGSAAFDRRRSQDLGYPNNEQWVSSPLSTEERIGASHRPKSPEGSDWQYALSVGANEARNSPSDEDPRQRLRQRPLTDDERIQKRDPSPRRPIQGGYISESGQRLNGTHPIQTARLAGLVHAGRALIPGNNRPQSKPSVILFYESTKPFYGFTNFSPHEVRYENKVYPTSEHLFQSMKFLEARPLLAEHIRTAGPQPRVALTEARRFAPEMEQVILHKFQQHPALKKQLLSTGDAKLIENAGANDAFWGNGADGKGRNELGIALMKLRDHFRLEGASRAQR